jgi:hypothetical protein
MRGSAPPKSKTIVEKGTLILLLVSIPFNASSKNAYAIT